MFEKTLELDGEKKAGAMGNLLPPDTILDILSRLPVESVLQFRLVSKTWKSLIGSPDFANMHLQRCQLGQFDDDDHKTHNDHWNNGKDANVGLGIVVSVQFKSQDKGNDGLYYAEYGKINTEGRFSSYGKLTKINHPPINKQHFLYKLVGSCNGLICIYEYNNYDDTANKGYVYIFNPITREHKRIQDLECSMAMGFGYLPSSKEYKIVKLVYGGSVQVYTLGSGSSNGWRNLRKISGNLVRVYPDAIKPGILANGALYWLNYTEMKILAFDLADEEFHVVPSPPCFLPVDTFSWHDHHFTLQELGRCLSVAYQVRSERLDIWSLEKTKNTTTTSRTKEEEYQSSTWSKVFSIKWEDLYGFDFKPFALTRSGDVLLWKNHMVLSRYDPKNATLMELVNYDDDNKSIDVSSFRAILHTNSFVSLKDL